MHSGLLLVPSVFVDLKGSTVNLHHHYRHLFTDQIYANVPATLAKHRTYYTSLQAFKILHNISPTYPQGLFSYIINVTGPVGRNPQRLLCGSKDQLQRKIIRTMIWNLLSPELYNAKTSKKFKSLFCISL